MEYGFFRKNVALGLTAAFAVAASAAICAAIVYGLSQSDDLVTKMSL